MLKLLKKYNKILLIVLGVVLMVAFLIGDAVRGLGKSYSGSGFKIGGRQISAEQAALGSARLDMLKGRFPELVGALELDERNRAEHWILLVEEAREAGFVGPEAEGVAFFTDEYPSYRVKRYLEAMYQQGQQPTEEQLKMVREAAKTDGEQLSRLAGPAVMRDATLAGAIAEFKGVVRLRSAYMTAARTSSQRMANRVAYQLNKAAYQYVLVPIDEQAAMQLPTPDDATLFTFFGKYKDVDAAASDVGVGYRLGPRVKLQYLTIDAAAIRSQIKVRTIDIEKKLRELTAKPDQTPEQLRAEAEKALREGIFQKIIEDAELTIKGEILRVTAPLADERVSGVSYKKLPENWESQRPNLTEIGRIAAERTGVKFGLSLPAFKVQAFEQAWNDQTALQFLPGIGQASIKRESGAISMPQLALSVRELANGRAVPLAVQVGVPLAEPLVGRDGSAYYLMITAARDASGPETLTEVRDRVVADYKRVQAYETLATGAEVLANRVKLDGMEVVARDTIVNGAPLKVESEVFAQRILPLRRQRPLYALPPEKERPWMKTVGNLQDLIISRAEQLDPSKPMADQDVNKRVFVISVPQQKAVAIAQLIGFEPLTSDGFRLQFDVFQKDGRRMGALWASEALQTGTDDPRIASNVSAINLGDQPFAFNRMIERLKVTDLKTRGEE